MPTRFQLLVTAVTLTLGLIGCRNDDNSSEGDISAQAEQTGTAHDAAIIGMQISPTGMPIQTTDANGEFKYKLGGTCVASISDVYIGQAPCRNVLLPRHLIIDGNICEFKRPYRHCDPQLNLVRTLMTIDRDDNPATITVPELNQAERELLAEINFAQGPLAFSEDATVTNFIGQFSDAPPLVSVVDAVTHLHSKVGGEYLIDRSFIDHDLIAHRFHYLVLRNAEGEKLTMTFEFMRDHKVNVWEGVITEQNVSVNPPETHEWQIKEQRYLRIGDLMTLHLEHRPTKDHMRVSATKLTGASLLQFRSESIEIPPSEHVTRSVTLNLKGDIAGHLTALTDISKIRINNISDSAEAKFIADELKNEQFWYSFHLFDAPNDSDPLSAMGIIGKALKLKQNSPFLIYYALNSKDTSGPSPIIVPDDCPGFTTKITTTSTASDLEIGIVTFPSPNDSADLCYLSFRTLAYKVIGENCTEIFKSGSSYCTTDANGNERGTEALQSLLASANMNYDLLDTGTLQVNEIEGMLASYITRFDNIVEIVDDGTSLAIGTKICFESADDVTSLGACSSSDADTNGILFKADDNSGSSKALKAASRLAELCVARDSETDYSHSLQADCPLSISK